MKVYVTYAFISDFEEILSETDHVQSLIFNALGAKFQHVDHDAWHPRRKVPWLRPRQFSPDHRLQTSTDQRRPPHTEVPGKVKMLRQFTEFHGAKEDIEIS